MQVSAAERPFSLRSLFEGRVCASRGGRREQQAWVVPGWRHKLHPRRCSPSMRQPSQPASVRPSKREVRAAPTDEKAEQGENQGAEEYGDGGLETGVSAEAFRATRPEAGKLCKSARRPEKPKWKDRAIHHRTIIALAPRYPRQESRLATARIPRSPYRTAPQPGHRRMSPKSKRQKSRPSALAN